MNQQYFLSQAENLEEKIQKKIAFLLTAKKTYIYGTSTLADISYHGLNKIGVRVSGFINDSIEEQKCKKQGLFIACLESVPKDSIIVISVLEKSCLIVKKLQEKGYDHYIEYAYLHFYSSEIFYIPYTIFSEIMRYSYLDIIKNLDKYEILEKKLQEERSKKVLQEILHYRVTLDSLHFYEIKEQEEQYFDKNIIGLTNEEVFVDCGAYDGEVTKKFIEKTNHQYQKIFLLEPDPSLFQQARDNLQHQEKIVFLNKGVYHKNGTCFFQATGNTSGCISKLGQIRIETIRLDDVIKEKITFVKMDIEGSESEALEGMKELIQQHKPKMAIAIYHKPEDLWKIPEYIHSLREDYALFIRNYTFSIPETILYCI